MGVVRPWRCGGGLGRPLSRGDSLLQAELLPTLPAAYADGAKAAGSLGAKRVLPDQDPTKADHSCSMMYARLSSLPGRASLWQIGLGGIREGAHGGLRVRVFSTCSVPRAVLRVVHSFWF